LNCAEAEPLLGAYLDRELDLTNSLAIEHHMGGCPRCAEQYAALERLHSEMAAADLEYRSRPGWKVKLGKASRSWLTGWRIAPVLAAATACVLILLSPWRLTSPDSETSRQVVDNHIRSLSGSHLVDVPSSDRHTVKPWFQGKTDFAPTVPDLSAEGFPLMGGRLDILRQQRVAALVYKRREHVINLFVVPGERQSEPHETWDSGGYHVLGWAQKGFRYWAVSDVSPADLRAFADLFESRL
jgi:anti-sigma factor RsiW